MKTWFKNLCFVFTLVLMLSAHVLVFKSNEYHSCNKPRLSPMFVCNIVKHVCSWSWIAVCFSYCNRLLISSVFKCYAVAFCFSSQKHKSSNGLWKEIGNRLSRFCSWFLIHFNCVQLYCVVTVHFNQHFKWRARCHKRLMFISQEPAVSVKHR